MITNPDETFESAHLTAQQGVYLFDQTDNERRRSGCSDRLLNFPPLVWLPRRGFA